MRPGEIWNWLQGLFPSYFGCVWVFVCVGWLKLNPCWGNLILAALKSYEIFRSKLCPHISGSTCAQCLAKENFGKLKTLSTIFPFRAIKWEFLFSFFSSFKLTADISLCHGTPKWVRNVRASLLFFSFLFFLENHWHMWATMKPHFPELFPTLQCHCLCLCRLYILT